MTSHCSVQRPSSQFLEEFAQESVLVRALDMKPSFFGPSPVSLFCESKWIANLKMETENGSRKYINVMWSLLNVCFPIATIFGQFLAAFLCRRIGRKGTALLASGLYIPGVLLCAASKSLANGINSVNATVWIVECAPTEIRGRMAAMQEFFMAFGKFSVENVNKL
ncbi:hypothetical protein ANCCEY_03688 [Ancylostoma ceylanicum]|uniref:Major facilitator superfamily (MFS) profile domain-containing protein n=1 Tax=Ancylostoma ceylanicum TaxID=53326 RepID=A0A0D6M183_9BILA|nr:hypothetical protein ANCCEY_03688 [Ancylostoma ceylanicum]